MNIFSSITTAPPDPILGITEAFKQDSNPNKINLSVGIYQDENGKSPLLESVKKAELKVWEASTSKSYLPIPGDPVYLNAVQSLIFGRDSTLVNEDRIATAHTPGGTGALRIAGEFIRENLGGDRTVWLSNPTWANHHGIFNAAGLSTDTYAYFNKSLNSLDWEPFLQSLEAIPAKDIIVLHGCCHNPTGADPTVEQWAIIGDKLKAKGILPVVDFAYQGFANGLEEDSSVIKAFTNANLEFIVCSSFSKNFGLYKERVGAVSFVASNSDEKEKILSQLKRIIRTNYSNPPAHGGLIVAAILSDESLTKLWKEELDTMRHRIKAMRGSFVKGLADKKVPGDFSFINDQNGMFSFSGLTETQVERLRDEFSIYIVKSGRINVAGLNPSNIDTVCSAIAEVS